MNRDALRLQAAIDVTQRAADRLRSSIVDDEVMLSRAVRDANVEHDTDLLRVLDAFVQRFQQFHEHMSHRLYPAIYRSEQLGERPPPPRNLFVWLEGLALFDSARIWTERQEIRNRLIHEYPLDASDRAIALQAAVEQSAAMLDEFNRALAYIARRDLLEHGNG